jgi:hypothetical protein
VRVGLSRWARAKAPQSASRQGGGCRGGRVAGQEGLRPACGEVLTQLERAGVVLLQGGGELIEQTCLQVDLATVVAGEALEFLGHLRVGAQGAQLEMITPQEEGQDLRVEGVTLGAADAEAIARPIQALGVDGVDDDPVIQQEVDDPPMGPLDGGPELYTLGLALPQPPGPLAPGRDRMGDSAAQHPVTRIIDDPHRILLVCPVHTDVVTHGSSLV